MNRLTRTGVAVIAAAAAFALAACSGSGGGGAGGGGGGGEAAHTLTLALDADLRPAATTRCSTRRASSPSSALVRRPIRHRQSGEVQPSLATGFTNNAENTQTTLTLRDGVTFADGSALDAGAGQGQPRPP